VCVLHVPPRSAEPWTDTDLQHATFIGECLASLFTQMFHQRHMVMTNLCSDLRCVRQRPSSSSTLASSTLATWRNGEVSFEYVCQAEFRRGGGGGRVFRPLTRAGDVIVWCYCRSQRVLSHGVCLPVCVCVCVCLSREHHARTVADTKPGLSPRRRRLLCASSSSSSSSSAPRSTSVPLPPAAAMSRKAVATDILARVAGGGGDAGRDDAEAAFQWRHGGGSSPEEEAAAAVKALGTSAAVGLRLVPRHLCKSYLRWRPRLLYVTVCFCIDTCVFASIPCVEPPSFPTSLLAPTPHCFHSPQLLTLEWMPACFSLVFLRAFPCFVVLVLHLLASGEYLEPLPPPRNRQAVPKCACVLLSALPC